MNVDQLQDAQAEESERQQSLTNRLLCCTAGGCLSSGSGAVRTALEAEVKTQGLEGKVEVCGTGCMGLCSRGPLVKSASDGKVYTNVEAADATALVSGKTEALESRAMKPDHPFYANQTRVVLANAGVVDPERLSDYIAAGGYQALAKAITDMTPREVIDEIKRSGLRGRGGGGYPTGLKWELVAKQESPIKYIVCNADEGDPGAFMDRSVLEGDPHRVLEGMALAAFAVGAQQGYIYVRGEYGLCIERLKQAIKQAEREHLIGNRIFDSGINFRVDLRIGAGAFVCGEETALIASIEGKRGQPRQRPPYPPERGLWDRPTLINNVETFANIPPIINQGGEWYASMGTPSSRGTKVFALAGRISHTGLVEVPMGMSLRRIIYEIGGGIPDGGVFKAAQTGGPSGGCIPAEFLDLPVDYEALAKIGSIMGSGGLIVMDQTSCMVDVARFFMEFCTDESCGKCIPCRAGTVQMLKILEKFTRGEATSSDLEMLEQLCALLRETSLCGLGQTAPNPVLSTLRYFRSEYDAHMREGRCPAGSCSMTREGVNA
jgi:bidirectional [NiFe] hydrogenase diaphorase subunit